MFYPVESLKRGGRFYLCWVADAWPLRFAATTRKQLWSQDIRKLCDDLVEVIVNESGRPANRFSLRLSSRLLRGLVRLYDRKATDLLSELCMINAHVFKHANKKFSALEAVHRKPRARLPAPAAVAEEPENEQRVEEMIQNSGNIVANIQDITLKEATITEFQLPPNDGFGEENPEQVLLQLLGDRTVEMMMAQPEVSAVQHSVELDAMEKSHDKTRLAPHDLLQMERLSEHDLTVFRKSAAEMLLPEGEFEKDIPEIPEIPPPTMPAPPTEIQEVLPSQPEEPQLPAAVAESPKQDVGRLVQWQPEDMELEVLEEGQQQAKRRHGKEKLIVDKRIKLSSTFLRARIGNTDVELRCEDFIDDIADTRVPWDKYSRRAASDGARPRPRMADALTRMYQRNLAVVRKSPLADREAEECAVEEPRQRRTRSVFEKTVQVQAQEELTPEVNLSRQALNVTVGDVNITPGKLNITDVTNVLEVPQIQEPMDIADLPTQKLEILSQPRKKTADYESPPKRLKCGYVSFRECQQMRKETLPDATDKENVPPGENIQIQECPQPMAKDSVISVSTMLREAGLADMQPIRTEIQVKVTSPKETQEPTQVRKDDSDSSETPLGSLDRTKVSLGDSVRTTDSQRFIRYHWGIEGTMMKILTHIKAGRRPLTVESLVDGGPVMPGYKRFIAARCFTSILKLKQHGFIKVTKDPKTLSILEISLGPNIEEN